MLDYLRIRGLALLDDVALELEAGMNVLTGETGAGKSIIVDALMLVRGARGRGDLVREGERAARVEAQFGIDGDQHARLYRALGDRGIELAEPISEEDGLVIERTLARAGRGRCVVAGGLTTLSVLNTVGEQLVDICSQHEHHSLTNSARHLELLDSYAQNQARKKKYTTSYSELMQVEGALGKMRERSAEGLSRSDYLSFQIEELERVAPEEGEYATLSTRVELLREAHHWQAFAHKAQQDLYEADDAIAPRIAALLEDARRQSPDSASLAEVDEQLETARVACEEAAAAASRLAAEVDLEPEELDEVQERLHELEGLRRKHGCEPDELAQRLLDMRSEFKELEHLDDRLAELEAERRRLRAACSKIGRELRQARTRGARKLEKAIEKELAALHIPDARLEAKIEPLPKDELGPTGIDRVEFLFSANPGEAVAPLNRVASGGELSRVLLAVKGVLATDDAVATYVFDEVDAGVGGAVAESIGRRLKAAAEGRQVLCITHLPQIAAFADAHFHVEKRQEGGRTVTRVRRLSAKERVEELARMLGGAKVTKSARRHAKELLDEAAVAAAR